MSAARGKEMTTQETFDSYLREEAGHFKEYGKIERDVEKYGGSKNKIGLSTCLLKFESMERPYLANVTMMTVAALELNDSEYINKAVAAFGRYSLVCEKIGELRIKTKNIPMHDSGEELRRAWKIRKRLGDEDGAKRIKKKYEGLAKEFEYEYSSWGGGYVGRNVERALSALHLGGSYKHVKKAEDKIASKLDDSGTAKEGFSSVDDELFSKFRKDASKETKEKIIKETYSR